MPAGYSSQPVSGYTGHVPGAKWVVGRRFVPPTEPPPIERSSLTGSSSRSHIPNGVHFEQRTSPDKLMVDEGTQSEMSFKGELPNAAVDYLQEPGNDINLAKSQASFLSGDSRLSMGFDSQGRPVRFSSRPTQQFENLSQQSGPDGYPAEYMEPRMMATRQSGRSKSLPRRKVEKDPFEGVESGWWSKGDVQRNKVVPEEKETKPSSSGSKRDEDDEVLPEERGGRKELNDIPAAGYSGHIQGLRHLGIGKSFNTAAKEARQQYEDRRRARSGGREQFYSNAGSQMEGSEHLNYSHVDESGMHSVSPY